MHAKTDSEGTSVDTTWPPRSPPRRPVYYVQSPSNHDVEKMSYDGSTPAGSPNHQFYHCSPIHHSRESSTSRFSASLKNPRSLSAWKHVQLNGHHRAGLDEEDELNEDENQYAGAGGDRGFGSSRYNSVRVYILGFCLFVLLFTLFCLILWGASKSYEPKISVKSMVFENFNVQAGNDETGVPTDMLTLNSTVKIHYRNPGTFFAVHVTSTPLELHYFQLKLASGQMKKFSQSRKSGSTKVTIVSAHQVPLYGGVPVLANAYTNMARVAVPLNLTFTLRSRAYILGRLVKSKFYSKVRCRLTLHGNHLGKPHNLTNACFYG